MTRQALSILRGYLSVPLIVIALGSSLAYGDDIEHESIEASLQDTGSEDRKELKSEGPVQVILKSGATVTGALRCVEEDCEIKVDSSSSMKVKRSNIRRVKKIKPAQFRDPNRTRYLYSPSAFSLESGEGYFSQKELIFSSLAYGVTDNLTILVGGVFPAWVLEAFNLILGAKYTFEYSESLHFAVGGEGFYISGFSLTNVFAGVTLGEEDAHLTLNVGKPITITGDSSTVGDLLISVSGNIRASQAVRLISENWLMPSSDGLVHLNGAGVRFQGDSLACDLALIFVGANGDFALLPVPWIDFTFNF